MTPFLEAQLISMGINENAVPPHRGDPKMPGPDMGEKEKAVDVS